MFLLFLAWLEYISWLFRDEQAVEGGRKKEKGGGMRRHLEGNGIQGDNL